MLVAETMMTSQNGTEAAATTMEITKSIRISPQGELTLLTRLIIRWDCIEFTRSPIAS